MRRRFPKTMVLVVAGLSFGAVTLLSTAAAEQSRKSDLQREQESTALAFAREHHPELADLLEQLQETNPKGYRSAISELARDGARLERIQERTPDRYDLELDLWKISSRIRLAAAQSAMGDADEVRARLRELLVERNAVKLDLLRMDRERLANRLERIEGSIDRLESDPDTIAERELDQLLRRARSRVEQVKRNTSRNRKESTSRNDSPKTSRKVQQPAADE
mgnify:FL=1